MGADQSKGKAAAYGSLFLQTDKSAYLGGETVTGKIYLNLLLPYPGNQVSLKFKGKEYAAFIETVNKFQNVEENGRLEAKHVDTHTLHEDHHQIIKLVVPTYSWSVLLPGQYSIPFAFVLPASLPSSFHQEGHKYVADISYTLSAILDPAVKDLADKLKFKQSFIVRQPIKSAMQGVGNEVQTKLTACCSSKGTNVLKAKFEKTFYAPGETAQVVMQLDNTQSQLSNSAINFSLKQKLSLTVKGKDFSNNATKVERNLAGIPAGGASDSNFISINLPNFQAGEWSPAKTTNLVDHLLSLKDNNDFLNCATRGKFTTSEYYLEVSCPMDGCCAPIPSISCPIEIYYPEINLIKPPVPTGWAPQEVSLIPISFGGPSVQMNAGGVSVNVNMDPLAMAAGTMLAAGNIAAQAMTGGNMTMNVTTNQQQSGGFQPNGGQQQSGGFQPNGGQQQSGGFQPNGQQNDGFHINMTSNVTGFETQQVNHGGFHAEFKMN